MQALCINWGNSQHSSSKERIKTENCSATTSTSMDFIRKAGKSYSNYSVKVNVDILLFTLPRKST